MTYVRLSVPVTPDMAHAARTLRGWVNTPGFADLCAGSSPIAVGTLERFHRSARDLYNGLASAMMVAEGLVVPDGSLAVYLFDVVDRSGEVVGAYSVRWRADDTEGARAEIVKRIELPEALTISREAPRIVAPEPEAAPADPTELSPTTPEVPQ